jgi:hypothetical protein
VGTYRSGTTSLFQYLSDHPDVCPSVLKETGYFLPDDAPAPSRWGVGGIIEGSTVRMGREPFDVYTDMFQSRPDAPLRVEATPSYLYEPSSASAILDALPDCRILITVRNPVAWVVSCYKLFVALRVLDDSDTFDSWAGRQLDDPRPAHDRPFELRTVLHGQFHRYIRSYIDLFGAERVRVVFFEDLATDPLNSMRTIADFAGIDADFYQGYDFKNVNAVRRFRRLTYYKAYATSRQRVLHAVERSARLRAAVLRVEERLLPRYMDWATEPVPDPVVARETQDRLADFFADVVPGLEHLLERRPPWEDTRRRVADIDP